MLIFESYFWNSQITLDNNSMAHKHSLIITLHNEEFIHYFLNAHIF